MGKFIFAVFALLFLGLPAAYPQNAGERISADLAPALAAAKRDIAVSQARRDRLAAEVRALKKDEKALSRALAAAAAAERSLDKSLSAGALRLAGLEQSQAEQSRVLADRRAELAEILAALERLGYNPPPAVLAPSKDAAQSLYAAALLGALLPQMQEKLRLVQEQADRLAGLQSEIKAEQKSLNKARLQRREEELRLKLLLAEKKQSRQQKRQNLAEEESKAGALAAKAQSLQDLLGRLRKVSPNAAEPEQLLPAVKFSALRGQLTLPVEGRLLSRFGQITDGKPALGENFAAVSGAAVLAPAEGVVRYAGDFRSYGQVLILDAGEDYYIVLAGLAKIYAALGQSVLQGEPVGNMETVLPVHDAGYTLGKAAPRLYIEIRKDGRPINPAAWWAGAPERPGGQAG